MEPRESRRRQEGSEARRPSFQIRERQSAGAFDRVGDGRARRKRNSKRRGPRRRNPRPRRAREAGDPEMQSERWRHPRLGGRACADALPGDPGMICYLTPSSETLYSGGGRVRVGQRRQEKHRAWPAHWQRADSAETPRRVPPVEYVPVLSSSRAVPPAPGEFSQTAAGNGRAQRRFRVAGCRRAYRR